MAIDLASVLGACKLAYDNICSDDWQRFIVNHHSVKKKLPLGFSSFKCKTLCALRTKSEQNTVNTKRSLSM